MWLARFVDKARLHADGKLSDEFEPFFGHRLATDGAFFEHFDFTAEAAVAAVREDASDDAMARWFLRLPGVTEERIAAWNELGPKLGKPGEVMERAFAFARRKYYGGQSADPRVVSVFTGIAWDEGYLDEYPFEG
jgi:hypothetical protein